MGLYDSFYDEDSKCPKCNAKVTGDWQTKFLENALGSWHKGDFVQYGNEYASDAPLIFNGKIPVHNSCRNCKSWLEAYAKVVAGKFKGVVKIELGRKKREIVVMGPETTAKSPREEFAKRLSHLQESCEHKTTKWMNAEMGSRPHIWQSPRLSQMRKDPGYEEHSGTGQPKAPEALEDKQKATVVWLGVLPLSHRPNLQGEAFG